MINKRIIHLQKNFVDFLALDICNKVILATEYQVMVYVWRRTEQSKEQMSTLLPASWMILCIKLCIRSIIYYTIWKKKKVRITFCRYRSLMFIYFFLKKLKHIYGKTTSKIVVKRRNKRLHYKNSFGIKSNHLTL